MIMYLKRVSDADIAKLHGAPQAIHTFIKQGRVERNRGPEYQAAKEALRIQMGLPLPPPPVVLDFDAYAFDDEFNAQKLWHALHFLLTGTADGGALPAAYLFGGEPIGDEDVGYGPARSLSAGEVTVFSDYLDALPRTAVLDRLVPETMMELDIYPHIWDEDIEELKEELGEVFDALRAYCRKCADARLGIIIVLS